MKISVKIYFNTVKTNRYLSYYLYEPTEVEESVFFIVVDKKRS